MILTNQTQQTTLSSDLKEAKSLGDKSFGLINKNSPRSLLLKTRFGLHTFFLKNDIDILILDSNNHVVVSKALRPNRIFVYNPIYYTVLELPQGTIKKSKTKIGDKLSFN